MSNYKLTQSDMRRFQRDIEKEILKDITKQVNKNGIEIECDCGFVFTGYLGDNKCPECGKTITLKV